MAIDPDAAEGPVPGLALFRALNPSLAAQGAVAETVPRWSASGAAVIIDGTVYFVAINLFAGTVVSNLSIAIQAAGTGTSLSKVGLYSTSGTRLALSADQAAGWDSTGIKTIAMIAPYVVPSTGQYFVALVAKTATTMPQPVRCVIATATGAVMQVPIGSNAPPYGVQTAQTDLPASATISTVGAPVAALWAAVS